MSLNFAPGPFSSSPRIFVFFLLLLQAYAEDKRPAWNVADDVNSIPEIDTELDSGANGIGFAVYYNSEDNDPERVGQSDSSDCSCNRNCGASEDIGAYLDTLRQLTDPHDANYRKELTLIVVYNKLENIMDPESIEEAGFNLAQTFAQKYWQGGLSDAKGNILLVITSTKYSPFFQGFKQYVAGHPWEETIGFDVASNDETFTEIGDMYTTLQIPPTHVWQIVAVSKCTDESGQCICTEIPGGFDRLKEAVKVRDGPDAYMVKVSAWDPDDTDTIRQVFGLDVDNAVTDYPERVNAVLQEPEFASKFQLADLSQNPWTRYDAK